MLAIVCPGQGSQTPGFLAPWLELPGVREHLSALSDLAGLDLIAHGTVSDEDTIKDTAVAQPLIVAAGLMAARLLLDPSQLTSSTVLAGHSVGEITASALAGALQEKDAMVFVRERANAMARAAAVEPTGMSAILGGDPDDVAAVLEAAGLTAANANGGGQVVAAGTHNQLEVLTAAPPAKARVIPLKVAGAFHTAHMAPAVTVLEALRSSLSPQAPLPTLLSNHDGAAVVSGEANLDSLIAQVSRPVRWDLCMENMLAMGVTGLLELPPAGTLTGLARRGMKGVPTMALKSPEDISAAREFIREHSGAGAPTGEGNA
ncbi:MULTISPECIES: ACP S-malonyltransferase [unclassified Arthrobacter]|uniref:ACP S-malonyltransferase n=1 Tax=unclassified Arthrobacter TaxID=235627 RepID=UPI001D14C71C|nr:MULTISPECIES: ACP S-malonyltransferase [unclassified Arthrobacter]MCC9177346.1 ACP S-malonyltransferase [Arthrobacter sp. zg-Y750]MCC3275059.1 ACP S-malonyltransferase [Arthrobacter sp. zg-Y20]MDK1315216.1 ACP S-malonyltransferase [Arthrobacter sp. zg.Y20]MDK1328077.1 ACP S-malonyltransferase [Arthrobacter sp. zg-Y1143]WIB05052.1 ACP S-malonyltransferase [Arthrobacter sp. zg-Y20]